MNPFEMVVLIFAIMAVAGMTMSRNKYRHRNAAGDGQVADTRETERLRDEVKSLKERLAVIERITIEKENTLEREIERLRDS